VAGLIIHNLHMQNVNLSQGYLPHASEAQSDMKCESESWGNKTWFKTKFSSCPNTTPTHIIPSAISVKRNGQN